MYNPPVVSAPEEVSLGTDVTMETVEMPDLMVEAAVETYVAPAATMPPAAKTYRPQTAVSASGLTLDHVIDFLQNFQHSNLQNEALKSENERLKKELADLRRQNEELSAKVADLEQNSETMQEDYETLMKIMNRARKLVLFEEEERPATKFKMDRNGNLEKVAE